LHLIMYSEHSAYLEVREQRQMLTKT